MGSPPAAGEGAVADEPALSVEGRGGRRERGRGDLEVVDEEAVRAGRGARRDRRVDGRRIPVARVRGVRRRDVARGLVGEADEQSNETGLPELRSVVEEDGAELTGCARGH